MGVGVATTVAALALAVPAPAQSPTLDCAGDFNVVMCIALAERLDTAIGELDLLVLRIETLRGIIQNETGDDGVALDEVSSNRLDLAWWGAWAAVGSLFAVMLAPMLSRAFRDWSG